MAKTKAFGALEKARTQMLVNNPFFGCLALHLNPVEVNKPEWAAAIWGDPKAATMAVDGVNMYYWPDFVLGLPEEELCGVVAHEVMHCALKHFMRRGVRHPQVWNWAGDYVINGDLLKANFQLPKERLHDQKYDGMSTEEVYERLRQEIKQESGGKVFIDDKGRTGIVIEPGSKGTQGCTPQEAEQIARDWDASVRVAINVARRANAGSVPGYLERLVNELVKPKVNWRDHCRDFIDGYMVKDYSWTRPNRRSAGGGVILPGLIPDAMHHLVMFIDISGSVSNNMAQAMVSEGAGALDSGIADKLTIAYNDTEVRNVDEYVHGDLVTCRTVDGGGTCFNHAMKWVRKACPDASCIIFLTDMMTSSFGEDPDVPVLWGAYLPEPVLRTLKVPFGNVIHVDSSM